MKHIRKFNESISTDIQEFCNNNLAYLIDDGYKVGYRSIGFTNIIVNIKKDDSRNILARIDNFTWYDIRDEFIPFMTILSRKYITSSIKLKHIVTTDKGSYVASKHVKLSDIINDIIEDMPIIGIDFNVKNI